MTQAELITHDEAGALRYLLGKAFNDCMTACLLADMGLADAGGPHLTSGDAEALVDICGEFGEALQGIELTGRLLWL